MSRAFTWPGPDRPPPRTRERGPVPGAAPITKNKNPEKRPLDSKSAHARQGAADE